MKKVYLLLTAICLAALTGCVKEEPYTLEEATIEVNLDTRLGTVSEQQGDRIEDVMIWVFRGEANNWNTLAGWRTYTPPTDAYAHTSLTLHIPVALCNGDSETYRLVAVLNKNHWGTDLKLSSETTYAQLTSMKFAHSDLIEGAISEGTPGTPHTMPVSHWCDVKVTKAHTHANGQCATANLDVFRSVAKTQLFVTKTSNDFDLEITGVTVNSANAPAEGMVLSSRSAADLKTEDVAPDWFTDGPTQFNADFSQSLKNQTGGFNTVSLPKAEGDPVETFVGSAFLYENAEGFAVDYASYDYTTAPTGSNGYYLTINYTVDGDAKEGHVPLPAAVRNHDYQVHLTVDKSGANLELIITINPWNYRDVTYPNTPLNPTITPA